MLLKDDGMVSVKGHLRIYEQETDKVLLDTHNDINPENLSLALANSLSNNGSFIQEIVFGNGGVRVNASNEYLYSSPQTIGRTASLYNETYYKVVDQHASSNTDPDRNYITVSHVTGNLFTDVLVHCTLEKSEPRGQNVLNNNNEIISEYTFSEVGLRTNTGDLITHICHYPVQKSLNITLIFDYLVRISMV
jgi:hypothetical protein